MSEIPHIDLSADYLGHVMDYVSELDRAWFQEHPLATEYFRPLIDGEVHTYFSPGTLPLTLEVRGKVKVIKYATGLRRRSLLSWEYLENSGAWERGGAGAAAWGDLC